MANSKLLTHIKSTYPKEMDCKECGLPFMCKWPTNKFCPECAEKRRKRCAAESQKRRYTKVKEERKNKREAEAIRKRNEKKNIPEHVCVMSDTCRFGYRNSDMACNYAYMEKHVRVQNGKHKIVNGICDLYEFDPDRKPRKKHLTL